MIRSNIQRFSNPNVKSSFHKEIKSPYLFNFSFFIPGVGILRGVVQLLKLNNVKLGQHRDIFVAWEYDVLQVGMFLWLENQRANF